MENLIEYIKAKNLKKKKKKQTEGNNVFLLQKMKNALNTLHI